MLNRNSWGIVFEFLNLCFWKMYLFSAVGEFFFSFANIREDFLQYPQIQRVFHFDHFLHCTWSIFFSVSGYQENRFICHADVNLNLCKKVSVQVFQCEVRHLNGAARYAKYARESLAKCSKGGQGVR